MITLQYCTIKWEDWGCVTRFPGGLFIESFPHDTPHYHTITRRCGYGNDPLEYCREHKFFHAFCEQYFNNRPSPTLLALAQDRTETDPSSLYEEIVVQTCQRWVRAKELPIIGGVDWGKFKSLALAKLSEAWAD